MQKCIVCGQPVADWSEVRDEFKEAGLIPTCDEFDLPMEAYSENMQFVLEGEVCSIECYEKLD